MNALYQRLKELDRDSFERLCFHLLKERHPGMVIKHVEGAAGDDGADTFAGSLDSNPIVWQAKAFSNGVGEVQKDQIRKSLKRALEKLSPKYWVLCLNIDLDIKSHRWWERYKKSHVCKVELGLWQGSDIVAELAHRKALCDLFFPGAALSPSDLKALVMKTDSCSDSQLAALAQETSEQWIERLKAHDARFNYQFVVSPEFSYPANTGCSVLDIVAGTTTVNAFARDVDALKLDPPKVSFEVKGTGLEKMRIFTETGKSQVLSSEEFGGLSTGHNGVRR